MGWLRARGWSAGAGDSRPIPQWREGPTQRSALLCEGVAVQAALSRACSCHDSSGKRAHRH